MHVSAIQGHLQATLMRGVLLHCALPEYQYSERKGTPVKYRNSHATKKIEENIKDIMKGRYSGSAQCNRTPA
jgi:hypothetical protein